MVKQLQRAMANFVFCLCVLVALSGGASAHCRLQELADVPVRVGPSGLFFIPAKIRTRPISFFVDTGSILTMLDRNIVSRVGLPMQETSERQLQSVDGKQLALGTADVDDLEIAGNQVGPLSMSVSMGTPYPDGSGGVFGADFLSLFDVEFDIASGKFRLFQQTRCGAEDQLYWADRAALVVLDMKDGHFFAPITIDGVRLTAILDSGAAKTMLSWEGAKKLGVMRSAMPTGNASVSGFDGTSIPAEIHAFGELNFGGEIVEQPRLWVSQVVLPGGDLVLGADFIATHRLYLATGDRRMFFTWNGRSGFAREG